MWPSRKGKMAVWSTGNIKNLRLRKNRWVTVGRADHQLQIAPTRNRNTADLDQGFGFAIAQLIGRAKAQHLLHRRFN